MAGAFLIDTFVMPASERVVVVSSVRFVADQSQLRAAVWAESQAEQHVCVRPAGAAPGASLPQLLSLIPDVLIDDCLVRVREEKAFIPCGWSALFTAEVDSH